MQNMWKEVPSHSKAQMKYCSTCKDTKRQEEFGKNRAQKDGLQTECKPCQRSRYEPKKPSEPLDKGPQFTAPIYLDEDWKNYANCKGQGYELFHPQRGEWEKIYEAKKLCQECIVQDDCLEYALNMETIREGIWGGLTPNERDLIFKRGAI